MLFSPTPSLKTDQKIMSICIVFMWYNFLSVIIRQTVMFKFCGSSPVAIVNLRRIYFKHLNIFVTYSLLCFTINDCFVTVTMLCAYINTVCFLFSVLPGCCFVTFFTRKAALLAQDALHNVKTLVGVSTTKDHMNHEPRDCWAI